MKQFNLPIAKAAYDFSNEKQMRAYVEQSLQKLSIVDEGALAFTDIVLANASIAKHGLLPKLPNDATKYLDGTGNWTVPGGGGGSGTGYTPLNWTMLYAVPPAPLSRTGWVATASATSGGAAASALDASTGTRWGTGGAIVPGTTWFHLDLGAATTIGAFVQNNNSTATDFPTSGNVYWSDDDSTWTLVAAWTTANVAGGVLTINLPTPVSHRYWKFLAEGTATGGSGSWWSIYEIYGYATAFPAFAYTLANQVFDKTPQTVVWARGYIRKAASTDPAMFGIGLDTANWYGVTWAGGSSSLLLVKCVAGVQTTLETISFDNDTEGHEVEMSLIIPNGPSVDNWFSVKVTRTNNPVCSGGYHDSVLDFTNAGAGATGGGQFIALGVVDAPYRGWSYAQLASSSESAVPCTIAYGGDTVTVVGGYKVHTFTTTGQTFYVEAVGNGQLAGTVVAGGGGGGADTDQGGGGGGGISAVVWALTIGSWVVTVGAGGTGGVHGGAAAGGNGSNSQIGALTPLAYGGVGGGTGSVGGTSGVGTGVPGATGGKAGGGNVSSASGSNSCAGGGGGGGASAAGAAGSVTGTGTLTAHCGMGGAGYGGYGGGGAGSGQHTGTWSYIAAGGNSDGGGATGAPGGTNTGGGGGGAVDTGNGQPGAAGIVIITYPYDTSRCP